MAPTRLTAVCAAAAAMVLSSTASAASVNIPQYNFDPSNQFLSSSSAFDAVKPDCRSWGSIFTYLGEIVYANPNTGGLYNWHWKLPCADYTGNTKTTASGQPASLWHTSNGSGIDTKSASGSKVAAGEIICSPHFLLYYSQNSHDKMLVCVHRKPCTSNWSPSTPLDPPEPTSPTVGEQPPKVSIGSLIQPGGIFNAGDDPCNPVKNGLANSLNSNAELMSELGDGESGGNFPEGGEPSFPYTGPWIPKKHVEINHAGLWNPCDPFAMADNSVTEQVGLSWHGPGPQPPINYSDDNVNTVYNSEHGFGIGVKLSKKNWDAYTRMLEENPFECDPAQGCEIPRFKDFLAKAGKKDILALEEILTLNEQLSAEGVTDGSNEDLLGDLAKTYGDALDCSDEMIAQNYSTLCAAKATLRKANRGELQDFLSWEGVDLGMIFIMNPIAAAAQIISVAAWTLTRTAWFNDMCGDRFIIFSGSDDAADWIGNDFLGALVPVPMFGSGWAPGFLAEAVQWAIPIGVYGRPKDYYEYNSNTLKTAKIVFGGHSLGGAAAEAAAAMWKASGISSKPAHTWTLGTPASVTNNGGNGHVNSVKLNPHVNYENSVDPNDTPHTCFSTRRSKQKKDIIPTLHEVLPWWSRPNGASGSGKRSFYVENVGTPSPFCPRDDGWGCHACVSTVTTCGDKWYQCNFHTYANPKTYSALGWYDLTPSSPTGSFTLHSVKSYEYLANWITKAGTSETYLW